MGGDYPDYTWPASADFTQLVITWSGPGEPGSIGGTVFDDLNQNGVQDAGEPGVPGVAVAVIDANDATQATTMTDADGHYRFDNLAAGIQYRVAFERPSGFLFAQPLSPPFTTAWNGYTNEGVHWESGKFPYISTTGDFNGDGNQDVFSLHVVGRGFSGPISGSVVDGYGDGRFSLPHFVILSEDQTPISVATGDFDGDGRDDVVVGTAGSSNDRVSLFLSSEFDQDSPNPAHVVTVGEDPRILRVADLDDDGAPEIVVANLRDQTVSVLRYDGLSLTRSVDIGIPGLAAIALGDTNGDGVPDLLAATNTTPYAALEVSVLFGDGAGGFSTPPVTTVGPLASVWDPNTNEIFAESMEVGDVNNDGVLDAVFGTFGGIGISNPTDDPRNLVVAALGDGTGSFAFIGPSDLADFAFGEQDQTHQISVAELNGDGLLDVVSGSGRVYFGDGQGGFDYANNLEDGRPSSSLFILPGNAYQRRPAVADFNGDGNLDLVAPTTAPSALVGDDPDDQVQLLVYLNHNTGPLSGVITLGPGEIIDTQDKGLFRLMNFEKLVNGDPADDPSNPLPLTVGATVAYSFTIENTASFDLGTTDHPFTLVDDYATPGDDSDDLFFSVSGPGTMLTKGLTLTGGDDNSDGLLNQGETWVIGAADQVAIGGELTNTGRVYIGQTEIAVDTASYVGQSSETVAVIDWKPGSNPSAIKVSDKGSTPVAILGSAVFDVTGIDIASITANDEVSADGATVRRRGRGYQASFEDFNGDGYLDLILHFETADLRDVLINDAGGEDAFLGDDMLYIFGRNADEPFEGTQQVHDPLKLIDG